MTRVRVTHSLDYLAADLRTIATKAKPEMVKVVRKGVRVGTTVAKDYAKASSGRHGKKYFKRISGEMTGLLEGEIGPSGEVEGNAVGAGWRHGENTDIPRTADLMGPALAREGGDLLENLFWP